MDQINIKLRKLGLRIHIMSRVKHRFDKFSNKKIVSKKLVVKSYDEGKTQKMPEQVRSDEGVVPKMPEQGKIVSITEAIERSEAKKTSFEKKINEKVFKKHLKQKEFEEAAKNAAKIVKEELRSEKLTIKERKLVSKNIRKLENERQKNGLNYSFSDEGKDKFQALAEKAYLISKIRDHVTQPVEGNKSLFDETLKEVGFAAIRQLRQRNITPEEAEPILSFKRQELKKSFSKAFKTNGTAFKRQINYENGNYIPAIFCILFGSSRLSGSSLLLVYASDTSAERLCLTDHVSLHLFQLFKQRF